MQLGEGKLSCGYTDKWKELATTTTADAYLRDERDGVQHLFCEPNT